MSKSNEATYGYLLVIEVFKHEFLAGKSFDLGPLDFMQEMCF